MLFVVMVAYLILSWSIRWLLGNQARPYFLIAFNFIFLSVLHGFGLIKIVSILSMSYGLTRLLPSRSKWSPVVIWTVGVALLFLNDIYKGYQFAWLSPHLASLVGPIEISLMMLNT